MDKEQVLNRPLVIYHADCPDGFGAAWCFWRRYGAGADYIACEHQTPPPDVAGRDVFMVDFSYKRDVVAQMVRSARSVTLIDHHATALEDLREMPGLVQFTDLERCGAALAWDYLYEGQPRPVLIEHIQDRDLWRFRLAGTREIAAYLDVTEFSFRRWDELMAADATARGAMIGDGALLLKKHRLDMQRIIATCARRMVIGGVEVPVVNIPHEFASDAGHIMAQGEPFAASYFDTAQGRKFSLRSTQYGADVGKIASQYGGGGHGHASGFMVSRDHPLAMQ